MRVGTSGKLDVYGNPYEDHPHACGDKLALDVVVDVDVGSSPCVWGQVFYNVWLCCQQRIIPMRVGTSMIVL